MTPSIAIITPNTLMAMGLKCVLEDMFPEVDVLAFPSLKAFYTDCNRPFVHFFVADNILLANAGEFDSLKRETIVLCESAGQAFADSGFKTIDVTLPENNLISSILHLHENGHQHTQLESSHSQHLQFEKLSGREREVLSLPEQWM